MDTGYSGTPLATKLGIKGQMRIALLNAPQGYETLLGTLPTTISVVYALEQPCDLIQFFCEQRDTLVNDFPALKLALPYTGMLWVSWRKGSTAKLESGLDENIIREIGLAHGLVDIKVIAVDAVWSGLKFVYRVKDRIV